MKKLLTILLAVASFSSVFAADDDAVVANRKWVREMISKIGVRVSTATVKTNANSTLTISSPFHSDDVTNAVAISLTISQPVATNRTVQSVAFSLWSLLVLRAFADQYDGKTVSITLKSGVWTSSDGVEHEFDFGRGQTLYWSGSDDFTFPEIPFQGHTCSINSDCNCIDSLKSASDIKKSAEEEYPKIEQEDYETFSKFMNWIDTGSAYFTERTRNGNTSYYIRDHNNNYFDMDNVDDTDAWIDAIGTMIVLYNSRINTCRSNYISSHTCKKSNPQHSWQTTSCGPNSWKKCTRNSSHKQGTELHNMLTASTRDDESHLSTCSCGSVQDILPHTKVDGQKVYTYSGPKKVGWTLTTSCSANCGWSKQHTHVCSHKYCHACEGGDGCDLPCQTCNGNHAWSTANDSSCSRCQCDDCGSVRTLTANSASAVGMTTHHGGFHWCTNPDHKDSNNDKSTHGKHCLCECGYNSCSMSPGSWDSKYSLYSGRKAVNTHSRTLLSTVQYEQIEGNTHKHFKKAYSDCTECGDPWGTYENHTFVNETTPHYKKLSNEKCALRKKCDNCGYLIWQTTEQAGSHSPDGDPIDYKEVEGGCKAYRLCSHCLEDYYTIENHSVGRDSVNKCKCTHCKTYQFEHEYNQTDACGNTKCLCGKENPSQTISHSGYTESGSGHVCACGKITEGHTYGDWVLVSQTSTTLTYTRTCTKCQATQTETTPVDQPLGTCIGGNHAPRASACGCQCGFYSNGDHYTFTNGAGNEESGFGSPSSEMRFHKFNDTSSSDHPKCICKCGNKHKFTEWTSSQKNQRTNVASSFCAVCADCKERDRTGMFVTEDAHVPRDLVIDGTKCGCKCGKLNHTASSSRFHPKHPNTCKCYGSSGDGHGSWHYPSRDSGCTLVCSYKFNGVRHLANTGSEPNKESLITAKWNDHTRKASSCGCKCQDYIGSNLKAEMTDLHYTQSGKCYCVCRKCVNHAFSDNPVECKCDCGEQHRKYNGGDYANKCTAVCQGTCGDWNLISSRENHTPEGQTRCGCQCNRIQADNFDTTRFHNVAGTNPRCKCQCQKYHNFGSYSNVCVNVCKICTGDQEGKHQGEDSLHTYQENVGYCGCECGSKITESTHNYARNACKCYGKNSQNVNHDKKELEHEWEETSKEDARSFTCGHCGETVDDGKKVNLKCKKCGETTYFYTPTDHECNDQDTCGCTGCSCSACTSKNVGYTCKTCGLSCYHYNEDDEDEDDDGQSSGTEGEADGPSSDPKDI